MVDINDVTFRRAHDNDLTEINDIYNYYVANSTCTWQIELNSIEERISWFKEHCEKYPVYVAELDNKIIGWASLSRFKNREGYKYTVELSVYIHHNYLSKGIGSKFFKILINDAEKCGYHSVVGGISEDQKASIKLHEKFGFRKVAHFKEAGFKFNKWLDVVYYQLIIKNTSMLRNNDVE